MTDFLSSHPIEGILGFLAIVAIWGGFVNWGGLVKDSEKAHTIIFSILFFTTSTLIVEKFYSELEFQGFVTNSLTNQKAEIVSLLKNTGYLKVIGDANDAAKEVANKLGNVAEGYNTFIINENPYDPETASQITGAIVELLGKNKTVWYEILSEEGRGRLTEIAQKIKGNGSINNYKACVIQEQFKGFPIINFVVLKNFDKSQEAYFGWGFNSQRRSDSVFWSNNPKVVDFFIRYHEKLREEPTCRRG